jgi:hypothetical protein
LTKENLDIDKTTFEIKLGLELYIPSLLELINGNIRWKSLKKILENKFNEEKERYNNEERFELRVTLYSICALAAKGNPESKQFLFFIDNVFKSLATCLSDSEKNLIKENISNLLEYRDGFLNYLGELCVLNSLMSSGLYRLEKTEYRLEKDRKGIDFKITNIESNQSYLIEVVNIELREDKMTDHNLIQKSLTSKIQEKLNLTDESGITQYTLIPVIWGGRDNVDNILKVKDFYEKTNFSIDRVQTPRVYMQLKVEEKTINRFGSILKCLIEHS